MKRALTILAAALLGVAFTPRGLEERFVATLDGAHAVPAVVTAAGATAHFTVRGDSAVEYEIQVARLKDVWTAGIYSGADGFKAVTLYAGPDVGERTGVLARGTLTNRDVLSGMTLPELIELMRQRKTYLEIRTAAHPTGELRGAIVPVTECERMVATEKRPGL